MAKLPVLMYHNISLDKSLGLTICVEKFEWQLAYLKSKNYKSIFASEIESLNDPKDKYVVITFDDVTINQLQFAIPLLQKYQTKATFFIPFAYVGKSDLWNQGAEPIMSIDQILSIDNDIVEFGHHSFAHKKYTELTPAQIIEDFDKSFQFISKQSLNVARVLAYPYGDYPKKNPKKKMFFDLLEQNNINMAFRIGNRLNDLPLKNKYEVQRIDIKGEESRLSFKLKLRFGKLKLF